MESETDKNYGEDEDNEEAGFMRLGKYFRLYRALTRASEARTPRDLIEIRQAMETVQDPCIKAFEDPVKTAIVQRLKLEEFGAGDEIFNYGDPGDKLFLLWSGQVQVEVPRSRSEVDDGGAIELVKGASYKAGQEFGELALFSPVKKRKMRLSAVQDTQLLALTEEDYRWCRGFSQESFVRERVNFLRTADRATLGEVPEAELQSLAARLREEHYMGEQVVLKQGAEVDKAIWVKSGFCKVIRQVNPRFREVFDLYANKTPPPPNPFAPTSNESAEAVVDQPKPGPGAQEFRRLLQQFSTDDGRARGAFSPRRTVQHRQRTAGRLVAELDAAASSNPGGGGSSGSTAPARNRKQSPTQARPSDGAAGGSCCAVVVDVLQEGRSFGVMEMMEGLDYQCSVVADPWVEVYVIKKNDLIRNTSKGILHRLFCDYKARLTDERIISQLKQNNRWNNYKNGLLEDIRNRRSNSGIIDRRKPRPRLAGVGDLRWEDYERVGNAEKVSDSGIGTGASGALAAGGRVQVVGLKRRPEMNGLAGTLVEQKEDNKWLVRLDDDQTEKLFKAAHLEEIPDEVKYIFNVNCVTDKDGAKKLEVDWERRGASMAALEKRIVMAVATASFREKIRRKQRKANGPLGKEGSLPAAAAAGAASGAAPAAATAAPALTASAAATTAVAGQAEHGVLPQLSGHHSPSSGSSSSHSPPPTSRRVTVRPTLARAGHAVVHVPSNNSVAQPVAGPAPGIENGDREARKRLIARRSTTISLHALQIGAHSRGSSSEERGSSPRSRINTVRFTQASAPGSARGTLAAGGLPKRGSTFRGSGDRGSMFQGRGDRRSTARGSADRGTVVLSAR